MNRFWKVFLLSFICVLGLLAVSYIFLLRQQQFGFEERPILPADRSQGLGQFGAKYENKSLELRFSYPKAYTLSESIIGYDSAKIILQEKGAKQDSRIVFSIFKRLPEEKSIAEWIRMHESGDITQDGQIKTRITWYPAVRYRTTGACETEHTVVFNQLRVLTVAVETCLEQVINDSRAIIDSLFISENGKMSPIDPSWVPGMERTGIR